MLQITSTNNAKIKLIRQLQKKAALRKKEQVFVIEGQREVFLALANKFNIRSVLYVPGLFPEEALQEIIKTGQSDFEIIQITPKVYEKIAYRNSTEGIIALAEMKPHKLQSLSLGQSPFLLVAEGIEKPGNLGAILRSVDGAGADALIVVNPVTDIYNPNVIRSSLGTIFSNQIAVTDINELDRFLKKYDIHLYTATLQNARKYYWEDYTLPTAIAVGAEDKGLTDEIRKIAKKSIYIPMRGQVDSLNVSVSAAILLYEVIKQRKL